MRLYHSLILILFLSGCGNRSLEELRSASGDIDFEELMEVPAVMQRPVAQKNSDETLSQKIIKTGGIAFESKAIEKDYQKIKELLPTFNGYIENENQNNTTQRISYDLTIRVPAEHYDTVYSSVSALAFRLDNRYTNVDDVTERYYDLKSRIKNKKALEQRYIELLSKATAIKDMLEIEKNLNEIRSEIERLEGQFNYLSKQISLSTIQVSFYEVLPYAYEATIRKGFGARVLGALDRGWQGFLSFLVGITTLWPFILILILSILGFRRIRKNWKRKKSA